MSGQTRGALSSAQGAAPVSAPTASLEERYELGVEIGRGQMGIVYKARDRREGRVVALKCLSDEEVKERPSAVAMFLAGARAAAALDHPNIVACFEFGQAGPVHYLTMEFLKGRPLDVVLRKRRNTLLMEEKLRIAAQTAAGMAHAHSKGIVHCDIKPANLFYTGEQVKIMDFDLAKRADEAWSDDSLIWGSPSYMAPEQSHGKSFDHRADQYAFGVTLFELMTGRVPFGSESIRDRQAQPPDPREFVVDVPGDVAMLIRRLLSKDPADRFEQSEEISSELERLCGQA